jgi:hypothetical protein
MVPRMRKLCEGCEGPVKGKSKEETEEGSNEWKLKILEEMRQRQALKNAKKVGMQGEERILADEISGAQSASSCRIMSSACA